MATSLICPPPKRISGSSVNLRLFAERPVFRTTPVDWEESTFLFARRRCTQSEPDPVRILQIGDYEPLCASRETILRLQGFSVRTVGSDASFDAGWVRGFDLAIVCQSVEAARLIPMVRALRRCHAGLFVLHIVPSPFALDTDAAFDLEIGGCGPGSLVNLLKHLGSGGMRGSAEHDA